MLATSEGSFSNVTQAGEFSASVYLLKMLAALHLREKTEFNFCPEWTGNLTRSPRAVFRERPCVRTLSQFLCLRARWRHARRTGS
jgi:hypothetical protein